VNSKLWRSRRKTDPNSKPPKRRKWYFKLIWKSSAIKIKDGKLRLSNGKDNQPLIVDWYWDKPKQVELGWNKASNCYELRACYQQPKVKPVQAPHGGQLELVQASVAVESGDVSSCDLGEIHPMVFTNGVNTDVFNGRLLRSKRQYQNKLKAKLSNLIDTKKRGSKRRKRLIKSKQKQLAKVKNQIKDIEHKLTSKAVSMLQEKSIQTLVIGYQKKY
jgi:putative transposase